MINDAPNKDLLFSERFDRRVQEEMKALVTDELIETFRRNPAGPHPDDLQRLLTYFRRGPIAGKYALLMVKPFAEYRIVALSGKRGAAPRLIDDRSYASPAEGQCAVFLKRVEDLLAS